MYDVSAQGIDECMINHNKCTLLLLNLKFLLLGYLWNE